MDMFSTGVDSQHHFSVPVPRSQSYSHTQTFQVEVDKAEDFQHTLEELLPNLPAAHNFRNNDASFALDFSSSSALAANGSAPTTTRVESSFLQVPGRAHHRSRSQGNVFPDSLGLFQSSLTDSSAASRPREPADEMYDDDNDISASIADGPSVSRSRQWDTESRSEYEQHLDQAMQDNMEGINKKFGGLSSDDEDLTNKWDQLQINQLQQFPEMSEAGNLPFNAVDPQSQAAFDQAVFQAAQSGVPTSSSSAATDSSQTRAIPFSPPMEGWLNESSMSSASTSTTFSTPQSPTSEDSGSHSLSSSQVQSPTQANAQEPNSADGHVKVEELELFNHTPSQSALPDSVQHAFAQATVPPPFGRSMSTPAIPVAAEHSTESDEEADSDELDGHGRGRKKLSRSHEKSDVAAEKIKRKAKHPQARLSVPVFPSSYLALTPPANFGSSAANPYSSNPLTPTAAHMAAFTGTTNRRGSQSLSPSPTPVLACVVAPSSATSDSGSPGPHIAPNTILPEWQVYGQAIPDHIIFRAQEIMRRDKEPQQKVARQFLGISPSTLSILLKGTYQHSKEKHINGLRRWCVEQERKFIRFLRCHAEDRKIEWTQMYALLQISEDYFVAWQQLRLPLHTRALIDVVFMKWCAYLGPNHVNAYATEVREQANRLQYSPHALTRGLSNSPMPVDSASPIPSPRPLISASHSASSSASSSPASALCTISPLRPSPGIDKKQKILSGRQRAASFTMASSLMIAINCPSPAAALPSPRSPSGEVSESKSPVTPQSFLDARMLYSMLQAKFAEDLETKEQPASNAALLALPKPRRMRAGSQPFLPSIYDDEGHMEAHCTSASASDNVHAPEPVPMPMAINHLRTLSLPLPVPSTPSSARAHEFAPMQQLPLQLQLLLPTQEHEEPPVFTHPPALLHALSHPLMPLHSPTSADSCFTAAMVEGQMEDESAAFSDGQAPANCA